MLEAAGAPERIAGELQNLHVPLVLVIAFLPFIAVFAYIPLSYTFGHLGQMLSPIHICQIVSNRYFGVSYGPVYKYIVLAALITVLLNIGYFLLLRYIAD